MRGSAAAVRSLVLGAFCALVAVALAWPAVGDTARPLTTLLLLARGELPDPNFNGSVVLVMNNLGPAPGGLIINKVTKLAVSHLFPDDERIAHVQDKLYFGGPVDLASVSYLFRADSPPDRSVEVLDGVYLSADREQLRKLLHRDKPMENLRIFIGYSGWGPGQLEAEIGRGDWTLAPASVESIFDGKSDRPWPDSGPVQRGRRT